MSNSLVTTDIFVKDIRIRVININGEEYLSLTDMAKFANPEEPRFPIQNWMRSKDVINFLGLWEQLNNCNFNRVEFDAVKNEAGENSFRISPHRWIKQTNAIGMISKAGKYNSGTYAYPDIAFEFASWIDVKFKLYLIQKFERLKKNEAYQNNLKWQANRLLSKANYLVHTEAIKNYIIPKVSEDQIRIT